MRCTARPAAVRMAASCASEAAASPPPLRSQCFCARGFFFSATSVSGECVRCPDHVRCGGGFLEDNTTHTPPVARPGYFMLDSVTAEVEACRIAATSEDGDVCVNGTSLNGMGAGWNTAYGGGYGGHSDRQERQMTDRQVSRAPHTTLVTALATTFATTLAIPRLPHYARHSLATLTPHASPQLSPPPAPPPVPPPASP